MSFEAYDGATSKANAAIGDVFERRGSSWTQIVPLDEVFETPDFAGVSVKDATRDAGDDDNYAAGTIAGIMYRGQIWVHTPATVVAGGKVTVNTSSGFFSSFGPNESWAIVPNATWLTSAPTNGIALLQIG